MPSFTTLKLRRHCRRIQLRLCHGFGAKGELVLSLCVPLPLELLSEAQNPISNALMFGSYTTGDVLQVGKGDTARIYRLAHFTEWLEFKMVLARRKA